MWLIFTSRINLSFNTQVQRFTCLHGITKRVCDFKVFKRRRNRVFPNKNACSVSLESKRPAASPVREKLLVGFISRLCQVDFCGQRCAALPALGTPGTVAWSAFSQLFACAAWDVTLQSPCKITIINISSFAVFQKNPPQQCQNCIITEPSGAGERWRAYQYSTRMDLPWTDHANGLWVSPSASRCWMVRGCKRCYLWVTAASA